MTKYSEIIEILVKGGMDTVGKELALKKTREIPEIEIDDHGNVKEIKGNGKELISRLLSKYEDVSGAVVVSLLARKLVSEMDKEKINQDLPPKLRRKVASA